ncbi:MAG: hypothetical protein KIT84_01400 [Labilithrix sp.]|nr:hypothetical protein [Labilithrix sp.]MCW5809642.1 hypothetical protein [Labilithrix sp.]
MTAKKELARAAAEIAKTPPHKLHPPLFRVFLLVAATGDVPRVKRVLGWMYGARTPAPEKVASALSTQAIDGFCAAAGLGDVTRGLPYFGPPRGEVPSLAARVAANAAMIHERVTCDAFDHAPPTDRWRKTSPKERAHWIERWRWVQCLAREGAEREAFAQLDAYLEALGPRDPLVGSGDELALAMELAHRSGADALARPWLEKHARRFVEERFLLETALCFPAVAARIAKGALRDASGLSPADVDAALGSIDAALGETKATTKASAKIPKIQKRRVSCSYSQVHLEPAALSKAEKAQVYFQKRGDAKAGMSLFETMVAIATPSETDYVDVEVVIAPAAKPETSLAGVAQAVAFPIVVRGALVLRSVAGGDEEPLVVPAGSYDVLARFFPKKAPRASAEAGLRIFKLALVFHAKGALKAPRTLELEA